MLKVDINDFPALTALSTDEEGRRRENISDAGNLSGSLGGGAAGFSELLSINTASQSRLKEIVLPMLHALLSSKESESKAGGLNILGSFCGLSYDFTGVKITKQAAFFQRNSIFVSLPIWNLVFQLQDDWDITIKEASVVLIQLCSPRNAINYFQFQKEQVAKMKLTYMLSQVPKVDGIYSQSAEESKIDLTKHNVTNLQEFSLNLIRKNKHARAAFTCFANESDRHNLLEKKVENFKETKIVTQFFDFITGMSRGQYQNPASQDKKDMILVARLELESQKLQEEISNFNPNFEDTRLGQPLSRKRQLEMELTMIKGKNPVKPEQNTTVQFFVDLYSDEQIQEIISIFRNDFKPPKNLWIEKQPTSPALQIPQHGSGQSQSSFLGQNPGESSSPDFFQDIFVDAIEQFNSQQMVLQQKQQNDLQQQVSSGGSSLSGSAPENDSFELKQNGSPSQSELHSPAERRLSDQFEDDLVRSCEEEVRRQSNSISPETEETLKKIKPVLSVQKLIFNDIQILPLKQVESVKVQTNVMQQELQPHNRDTAKLPRKVEEEEKSDLLFEKEHEKAKQNIRKKPKSVEKEASSAAPAPQHTHLQPVPNVTQIASQNKLLKESRGSRSMSTDKSKRRSDEGHLLSRKLKLVDNDFFSDDDKRLQQIKPQTQRNAVASTSSQQMHPIASVRFKKTGINTHSTPDFNAVVRQPTHQSGAEMKLSARGKNNSLGSNGALSGSGSQGSSGGYDQKISRKAAQTYLSGLSKGYISNMVNINLINNCLTQSQTTGSGLACDKSQTAPNPRKANKSFENLAGCKKLNIQIGGANLLNFEQTLNQSKSTRAKKLTLSSSPKKSQGDLTSPGAFVALSHRQKESSQTRGKPKSGKKLYQMQKSGSQPNSSENPQALNDLNVLLKAIEKDLSQKLKTNSGTPNNSILKKIEDQMRLLGYQPLKGGQLANPQTQSQQVLSNQGVANLMAAITQLQVDNKRRNELAAQTQLAIALQSSDNLVFNGTPNQFHAQPLSTKNAGSKSKKSHQFVHKKNTSVEEKSARGASGGSSGRAKFHETKQLLTERDRPSKVPLVARLPSANRLKASKSKSKPDNSHQTSSSKQSTSVAKPASKQLLKQIISLNQAKKKKSKQRPLPNAPMSPDQNLSVNSESQPISVNIYKPEKSQVLLKKNKKSLFEKDDEPKSTKNGQLRKNGTNITFDQIAACQKQLARQKGVMPQTVKNHKRAEKMDCSNEEVEEVLTSAEFTTSERSALRLNKKPPMLQPTYYL